MRIGGFAYPYSPPSHVPVGIFIDFILNVFFSFAMPQFQSSNFVLFVAISGLYRKNQRKREMSVSHRPLSDFFFREVASVHRLCLMLLRQGHVACRDFAL